MSFYVNAVRFKYINCIILCIRNVLNLLKGKGGKIDGKATKEKFHIIFLEFM